MPAQKLWRCNGRILSTTEVCTVDRDGNKLDAPIAFDASKHEEVDA